MKKLLTFIFLFTSLYSGAQSLSGYVMDRDNNPVPFANVYFQGTTEGTTTDAQGYYFIQLETSGYYKVVYTAIGFVNQTIELSVKEDEDLVKNIYLDVDIKVLNEAVIKSKRKDPAYEIIQNAIKAKPRWNNQFEGSTCNVYLKATEIVSEKEKKKRERKKQQEKIEKENNDDVEEDLFEKEKKEQQRKLDSIAGGMNMVEAQMVRHFQVPNRVKEIREGYKKYGSTLGLYFTSTAEDNFNFYDNLMDLENLSEVPVISPLHATSVLTYKFSLEETEFWDGDEVYRIKVTPRKKGNAAWSGTIWIQKELYCLRKVALNLKSDAMIVFKDFDISQDYFFVNDSVLVLDRQQFDYFSKAGSSRFRGQTIVRYSNYILNPEFDKKFFGNEVAVTTQEAYDKDSTYWKATRPEPLTPKEQRYQFVKDSLYEVTHSQEYLDSLDLVDNKIDFLKVVWDGIYHSNRTKKQYWGIVPALAMYNPFSIGGFRIFQGGQYFKLWKNKKYVSLSGDFSYGIRNKDWKGSFRASHLYDPMHQGQVFIGVSNRFNVIASNGAVTNLIQRNNWIEEKTGYFSWRRELINGLYIHPRFQFVERLSADKYRLNPDFDDAFDNNHPRSFETYQASLFSVEVQYTPFQKYMTEPYKKVILGSKWPTFFVEYTKGIPKLFGSDVNHDFIRGGLEQKFKLATLGTSNYGVVAGKFLHTKELPYEDQQIFPRGDMWFFSSSENLQLQDTTYTSTNLYLKTFYVHHFNGAVVNYIPLVKKMKIYFTAGGSSLWIKDTNKLEAEAYVGVEKSFRVMRYRYRFGVFYVQSITGYKSTIPGVKFAIQRYNVKDKSWEY